MLEVPDPYIPRQPKKAQLPPMPEPIGKGPFFTVFTSGHINGNDFTYYKCSKTTCQALIFTKSAQKPKHGTHKTCPQCGSYNQIWNPAEPKHFGAQ